MSNSEITLDTLEKATVLSEAEGITIGAAIDQVLAIPEVSEAESLDFYISTGHPSVADGTKLNVTPSGWFYAGKTRIGKDHAFLVTVAPADSVLVNDGVDHTVGLPPAKADIDQLGTKGAWIKGKRAYSASLINTVPDISPANHCYGIAAKGNPKFGKPRVYISDKGNTTYVYYVAWFDYDSKIGKAVKRLGGRVAKANRKRISGNAWNDKRECFSVAVWKFRELNMTDQQLLAALGLTS